MSTLRVAALILGCAAAGYAADFSGIWVGQVPARNSSVEIAFKFTQNAGTLGGKLYGDYRSTPIIEGKIEGEQISFVVIAEEQAGNQINETRLRFTGTYKDGEIELTREREESRNAGNGGAVQIRNNSKQTFRLKRLI